MHVTGPLSNQYRNVQHKAHRPLPAAARSFLRPEVLRLPTARHGGVPKAKSNDKRVQMNWVCICMEAVNGYMANHAAHLLFRALPSFSELLLLLLLLPS
jgi:hypothetical protein